MPLARARCCAAMPPKAVRCFSTQRGADPAPKQLHAEGLCPHCQQLWDEQRWDTTEHKAHYQGLPCTGAAGRAARADAPAPALPAGRLRTEEQRGGAAGWTRPRC